MYNIIRHQLISDNIDNPIQTGMVVYINLSGEMSFEYPEFYAGQGTPIGVVVIPEGLLPDGKARMVGLYSIGSKILCASGEGQYLPYYQAVPTTNNNTMGTTGYTGAGLIPSDLFYTPTNEFISICDPQAAYRSTGTWLQAPYFGDVLNPYYNKKEINPNNGYNMNAFSDFNGLENTLVFSSLALSPPAPYACWTYNDGVSNTQWYLPSLGELCLLSTRISMIQNSFNILSSYEITNEEGISVSPPSGTLWSSTVIAANAGWICTTTGNVSVMSSTTSNLVWPFAQIIK